MIDYEELKPSIKIQCFVSPSLENLVSCRLSRDMPENRMLQDMNDTNP